MINCNLLFSKPVGPSIFFDSFTRPWNVRDIFTNDSSHLYQKTASQPMSERLNLFTYQYCFHDEVCQLYLDSGLIKSYVCRFIIVY